MIDYDRGGDTVTLRDYNYYPVTVPRSRMQETGLALEVQAYKQIARMICEQKAEDRPKWEARYHNLVEKDYSFVDIAFALAMDPPTIDLTKVWRSPNGKSIADEAFSSRARAAMFGKLTAEMMRGKNYTDAEIWERIKDL